jgi:hypothetical protein
MHTTVEALMDQGRSGRVVNRIEAFFQQFAISTIAHDCGIRKSKGTSVALLLTSLFALPFLQLNLYRGHATGRLGSFGKDAAYQLLRCHRHGWRRLLLLVAARVCALFQSLTSADRDAVLILDDTTLQRPRGKQVELLARVRDHAQGRFIKGFRMLTLCWSDGASLAPLDFALLSSANAGNRLCEATKAVDGRSCGAKRRLEAVTKATDLIGPMLRRALATGIRANYLVMDSWFGMPAIIATARAHLPVICMIKRTPKVLYGFEGRRLSVEDIYRRIRKRRGRAKILASAVVTMNDGLEARIVFVRDRRKKDWLALLSTRTDLPEADVVRIYGKRWDIEVFFRTVKQHLHLEKGCQARDFDALIAHTTLVMLRYIFLSLEQRRHDDPRTLGLLFHACCEELRDLDFLAALKLVIDLALQSLQQERTIDEELCRGLKSEILDRAIDLSAGNKVNCQRSLRAAA